MCLEAVSYGDFESPYIRIDLAFMRVFKYDFKVRAALDFLISMLNLKVKNISLDNYDIYNNKRVVHKRKPFLPKYDRRDRWLKRVITTRDVTKSRVINTM